MSMKDAPLSSRIGRAHALEKGFQARLVVAVHVVAAHERDRHARSYIGAQHAREELARRIAGQERAPARAAIGRHAAHPFEMPKGAAYLAIDQVEGNTRQEDLLAKALQDGGRCEYPGRE